jgi:hypothetical protein
VDEFVRARCRVKQHGPDLLDVAIPGATEAEAALELPFFLATWCRSHPDVSFVIVDH